MNNKREEIMKHIYEAYANLREFEEKTGNHNHPWITEARGRLGALLIADANEAGLSRDEFLKYLKEKYGMLFVHDFEKLEAEREG